jgi:hypothetical protein
MKKMRMSGRDVQAKGCLYSFTEIYWGGSGRAQPAEADPRRKEERAYKGS